MTTRDHDIERAVDSLETVMRVLRSQTVDDWVGLDLTMAQLKTLFTLEYAGPATIGQVAERLHVSLPTASHLVDRLVQGGYAERTEDPADRRRTLAASTGKGSQLAVRLRQGGRDQLITWLSHLEDDDRASLVRGMTALAEIALASTGVERVPTTNAENQDRDIDTLAQAGN